MFLDRKLLSDNKEIVKFINSDQKLSIGIEKIGLCSRAINSMYDAGVKNLGELLLASGGKYTYIPGIGYNQIFKIENMLNEVGIDIVKFKEKTIYRYGFKRYTSLFLVNLGIILADDLVNMTFLDFFVLLGENYKLTIDYISEFERKDVHLKSSTTDMLLFEIDNLSNRIKNALIANGIYRLSEILGLNLNKNLKYRNLGDISMLELYDFVARNKCFLQK